MKIRVYLDAQIKIITYDTNIELYNACVEFDKNDINWEFV